MATKIGKCVHSDRDKTPPVDYEVGPRLGITDDAFTGSNCLYETPPEVLRGTAECGHPKSVLSIAATLKAILARHGARKSRRYAAAL